MNSKKKTKKTTLHRKLYARKEAVGECHEDLF